MAHVTHEIIVNAPVARVFGYWKNFENFPRFMDNIESIETTGSNTTHWKMKGPAGTTVEWDAETTYVEENKKIAWKSLGGTIETHGAVLFEAIDEGRTRITVGIEYNPPGGAIGEAVARLFNNPEQQLKDDLLRFKQAVQSGSTEPVAVTDDSLSVV